MPDELRGYEILVRALRQQQVETAFFLMGGPLIDAANACLDAGIRLIDVRHEQAAAMMAHAYSRVLRRPAVCMACSGPGTANLVTGIANAFVDCAPVVAIGGSSPVGQAGRGVFQELDQVELMKPITRWAVRVYDARRIPEILDRAFGHAFGGQPGPVYVDLPSDVLYAPVGISQVGWVEPSLPRKRLRSPGDPGAVRQAVELIAQSSRPIAVCGSGALWSDAGEALEDWVDLSGIPAYMTPQARGLVPEDHPLSFLDARAVAFREADLVLVVGTRLNHMIGFGLPPRFDASARFIQVDIEPAEIARTRAVDVGIVGDAQSVLRQLTGAYSERAGGPRHRDWVERLRRVTIEKSEERERAMETGQVPIHPLRLCKEIRDFMDPDAILSVDGHEILNYARQSIPTFVAGHRINSGPFGNMGVGLPFGLGAKAAKPGHQVIVLHGDGSFGLNGMEVDTAVRHGLNIITVISNNGGWTSAEEGFRAGRDLGFTRYDRMAEALGCHAEYVERPEEIRGALERSAASGRPAVVNVITDPMARAQTAKFGTYRT